VEDFKMNKRGEYDKLIRYVLWGIFFAIVLIAGTALVKYLTK